MKVVLDTSGMQIAQGGITTYTRELLQALPRVAPQHQFTEAAYHPRFGRRNRMTRAWDTLQRHQTWLRHTLPQQVQKEKADLLHVPGVHVPPSCQAPMVATIHDLYPFRNPGAFRWYHQWSSRRFTQRALRGTAHILAVSEFSRNEVLDLFGSHLEGKITVTREAAHPRFRPSSEEDVAAVKARYELRDPFYLSVCTLEPRKNLSGLLEAMAGVADQVEHTLVLTGAMGWKSGDLAQRIDRLGLRGRVVITGYVPDDDLPALYSAADLFAYPSHYEGFGLPVLEAMSCGCPVVTSNVASIPEVAGDAAWMVEPTDPDTIATALLAVATDAERREAMRQKGLERAAQFSWERCARETVAVYESVVDGSIHS